jgi:hypothetical protein
LAILLKLTASMGLVLAGVVAVGFLAARARRSCGLVIGFVAVLIVFPGVDNLGLHVTSATLHPSDLLSTICVVAATTRTRDPLRLAPAPARARTGGGLFGLMVLISLLRGFPSFGNAAVEQTRPIVGVAALAFYAVKGPVALDDLFRLFKYASIALAVLALSNLARHGLGSPTIVTYDPTTGDAIASRILLPEQALTLTVGLLLIVLYGQRRQAAVWGALLAILILASQQRTVWLAALFGFIAFAVQRSTKRARANARRITIVLFALSPLAFYRAAALRHRASLALSSLISGGVTTGTAAARQQTWTILVGQTLHAGLTATLIGLPLGTSWDRFQGGHLVTFGPHNSYVQIFARLGLAGLLLVLLTVTGVLRRHARGPLAEVRWPYLALFLGFGIGYFWAPVLGLLLGLLLRGDVVGSEVSESAAGLERTSRPQGLSSARR